MNRLEYYLLGPTNVELQAYLVFIPVSRNIQRGSKRILPLFMLNYLFPLL